MPNRYGSLDSLRTRKLVRGMVERTEATTSRPSSPSQAFQCLRDGILGVMSGLVSPIRVLGVDDSDHEESSRSYSASNGSKEGARQDRLNCGLASLSRRESPAKASTEIPIPIPESPPLLPDAPVPLLRLRWSKRKLTISIPMSAPPIAEINVYHNLYPDQDIREQTSSIAICFSPVPVQAKEAAYVDPETGKIVGKTTVGLELEDIDDSWFPPTLPREYRRPFEEVWEEWYGRTGEPSSASSSSSIDGDEVFFDAEEEFVTKELKRVCDGPNSPACLSCRPALVHAERSDTSTATRRSLTEVFPEIRLQTPLPTVRSWNRRCSSTKPIQQAGEN